MARPKPQVLLSHQEDEHVLEVCEEYGVFAVYYQGKPIMVRRRHAVDSYPGPKYKKSTFTEPGHAFNLANRLNKLFNTTEFDVRWMRDSRVIHEDLK
jgi:hypothetical protein